MAEYSAASQKSLLKRDYLRAKLAQFHRQVASIEQSITAEETEKQKLAKGLSEQDNAWAASGFNEACQRISQKSEMLRIFRDRIAKTQAELEALNPTPEKQKARTEGQDELARLAGERLEKDRRVHNLLKDLRSLLAARVELTARMAECAAEIDLALGEDGLDAARFEGLLAALPVELADASERWYARILGKENGFKVYICRDDRLVLPENLASSGIYYFSDAVKLSEQQARELLYEDGSAPPSVMTFAGFAAVMAKAGVRGVSNREICFWEDVQRAVEARKEQASKSSRPTVFLQNVPAYKSNGFVSDLRIRATVKSPLLTNGRQYQKGDSFDLAGKQEAWRLALSGTIVAPWEG